MPDGGESLRVHIQRNIGRDQRQRSTKWRLALALRGADRAAAGRGLARSEPQALLMVTRDIGPYVRRASDRLHEWRERRAQRRALMRLDDRMLGDIGIGRAEAEQEYRKPFWR